MANFWKEHGRDSKENMSDNQKFTWRSKIKRVSKPFEKYLRNTCKSDEEEIMGSYRQHSTVNQGDFGHPKKKNYFIISYCLSFPRFSHIFFEAIYQHYKWLYFACIYVVLYVFHVFFWNTLKSVLRWSNFPELVQKEQWNLSSTGSIINGAIWFKNLYNVHNKSQTT